MWHFRLVFPLLDTRLLLCSKFFFFFFFFQFYYDHMRYSSQLFIQFLTFYWSLSANKLVVMVKNSLFSLFFSPFYIYIIWQLPVKHNWDFIVLFRTSIYTDMQFHNSTAVGFCVRTTSNLRPVLCEAVVQRAGTQQKIRCIDTATC